MTSKWIAGAVLATLGVVVLTGCGATEKVQATKRPSTFSVMGKIKIDDFDVKVTDREIGKCELPGFAPKVVITDPAGKRVALADMGWGVAPAAGKYYVPGRCDIPFEADRIEKQSGVYSAMIDGHPDVTASFTSDSAANVQLHVGAN